MKKIEGGLRIADQVQKKSRPDQPLVSIITVCLNSRKHLEQTIQSVIGQTYGNIEYIIVDGGSTDGTVELIKKYSRTIDYWVSEPDRGIYDAMNKGVSLASGDWVGIINSDDFYLADTVKSIIKAAAVNKETRVFYGNLRILGIPDSDDASNYEERKGQTDDMLKKFSLNHPTCFVSKTIYEKFRFNTEFRVTADYDFFLKLWTRGIGFYYIDEPLTYQRPGGISNSYRATLENYRVRKKYGSKIAGRQLCRDTQSHLGDILYHYRQNILKALFGKDCRSKLSRLYRNRKAAAGRSGYRNIL